MTKAIVQQALDGLVPIYYPGTQVNYALNRPHMQKHLSSTSQKITLTASTGEESIKRRIWERRWLPQSTGNVVVTTYRPL